MSIPENTSLQQITAKPCLAMKGITKTFGATKALNKVHLTVGYGSVHALVGENGSGKSTLMKILAGAYSLEEGEMVLDGELYHPKNASAARKCGVAMIHQELTLCSHMSVQENVLLGVEDTKFGWIKGEISCNRARRALEPLGLGGINLDTPVGKLPIAQRQLVEIARALATDARLIVLDEPTSSLTEADAEKLFEVIKMLAAQGKAVIFISHFLNEIREVCDKFTVLRDGDWISTGNVAEVTDDELVKMMVGREISDLYPRSSRSPGEIVIQLDNVAGEKLPVNASIELRKGEVFGIAGLNGSGRSETLRVIFGLDNIKSGNLVVKEMSGFKVPMVRWGQKLGMLSEDRKEEGLALNLSIEENISLPNLARPIVLPSRLEYNAAEWINRLMIKCTGPQQRISDLSGGNQQKAALARILSHGADVLLLDEPTRGIDVGSKEQIYKLIDEAAKSGMSILIVSSYLPELLGVCDRIAVMRKGILSEPINAHNATQEQLMHAAVGG